MERINRLIALIAVSLLTATANAQTIENLWITGSAVPGGTQQLTPFPGNQFKFAGELLPGEVKVITTPEPNEQTQYLAPRFYKAYIVNNGLAYQLSRDAQQPGWIVTFRETRYRFTVNTDTRRLTGELFQPWDELFLVGGCVACGWNAYVMLPFRRDNSELCLWTWTGPMREDNGNVEPRRFKIMGQNAWDPKQLHPYSQDESPLTTTQLRTGGDDNKWQLPRDGIYRLTVDVFRETFHAEYLGSSQDDHTAVNTPTAADSQPAAAGQPTAAGQPWQASPPPAVPLYDLQGRPVTTAAGGRRDSAPNGIYIHNGKKVIIGKSR
jgi:hypothetical protein